MKVVMRPGKGIFLYVDDEREPRSISLPWDPDLADKIQKALETSKKNGAEGMLMTFSPSLKQEELIHLNPRALGLAPKEPIVLPEYLRE